MPVTAPTVPTVRPSTSVSCTPLPAPATWSATVSKSLAALVMVTGPLLVTARLGASTAPLWVSAPPVVTVSPPLMVEAPRSKAFTSLSVDGVAAHDADRAEVVGVIQVMLLAAPAVRVVGPATVRLPLSVMAPLVVTVSPPLMVEAPRSKAFTSLSIDGIAAHDTDRAEVVGVIQGDVVGGPGREGGRAGDGEIAAIGNRAIGGDAKAPLMVEAPRSKAFTSLSVTLLPLTTLTVLKSLALFR